MCLKPGTRVRAVADIFYMVDDVAIHEGTFGTVVRSVLIGLSLVSWDTDGPATGLQTSHDCLELAEPDEGGSP